MAKPAKDVFSPTAEQAAIYKAMCGKQHVIGEALAGTGKTATAIQGITEYKARNPTHRVTMCAFNRSVEKELQQRLPPGVPAKTIHKLLFAVLREGMPDRKWEINQDKTYDLLDTYQSDYGYCDPLSCPRRCTDHKRWKKGERPQIHKLVSVLKNLGHVLEEEPGTSGIVKAKDIKPSTRNLLSEIGTRFDILTDDTEILHALSLTILYYSVDTEEEKPHIDFDDMLYLPYYYDLWPATTYDLLVVDECQDTNLVQQTMIRRLAKRLMIIGDTHQAIYGFRGADTLAMKNIQDDLENTPEGAIALPLTTNWRCPTKAIQLAQDIVPKIRACKHAPEGKLYAIDRDTALRIMQPGDMVLCRTNAPCIGLAFDLWKRNKRAFVRGRDFSKGLLDLVDRSDCIYVIELGEWLTDYIQEERLKAEARGRKGKSELQAIEDRVSCLSEMVLQELSKNRDARVSDLTLTLKELFQDTNDATAVCISSVHRAKGLEAKRVFILHPEQMPHPMAEQPWEQEQEANLAYVAVTRVKFTSDCEGELYFIGGELPAYFPTAKLTPYN